MKKHPCHDEQIVALRRIEGQVRGIQKMIEERRYCVDILVQINSIEGALLRVQDNVLEKHLGNCVANALKGRAGVEKEKKINEIITLIKQFR